MGIDSFEQAIIKAIAENNMLAAKKCSIAALQNDNTQKNAWFVDRYLNILQASGCNTIEPPMNLRGILVCEDVSESFLENRYYITEKQKKIADSIFKLSEVAQKLLEMRIPYKNATLLYGQPGTGKTMFGRYIAYRMGLPFCYLNFAKAVDSLMGATSKNIAQAFSFASSNPCVFMLDEVDTISCNRERADTGADKELGRVTVTLMQEFDKLPNSTVVIAATNRLDIIDNAFVSRFPQKYEMAPFSDDENRKMVEKFLTDVKMELSENEISEIVQSYTEQRAIMSAVVRKIAEKI